MANIPAEELIKLLREKDLVAPEVLDDLLAQVAESRKGPKPIHAAALAKILVDRGYLSRLLAQRLMTKLEAEWAQKSHRQKPDSLLLAPLGSTPTPPEEELRLADDEPVIDLIALEDDKPVPPPVPSQSASRQPPPKSEPSPTTAAGERSQFDDLLGELAPATAPTAGPVLTPDAWQTRRKNPWESPLFLFGSGSLLILVFVGVVLLWSLNRRSGDDLLAEADADFHSGSYTQAVYKYGKFLEDFPQHPQAGLARIRRGLARIRQTMETSDPVTTFQVLKEIVPELAKLPDFHAEADAEMTSVLPGLAQQIAQQALKNRDPSLVSLAEEVLASCNKYIPKDRLPVAKLADIQATVELAKQSILEKDALATTVKQLTDCRATGRLDEAYAIYEKFCREYPHSRADSQLQQVMAELAEAEKERVRFEPAQPLESPAPPSSSLREVTLYSSWIGGPAPFPENSIAVLTDQESVYAVQMATGKLLWQRGVSGSLDGSLLSTYPRIAIDGEETVALPDRSLQALVLAAVVTGQIKKLIPIGESPSGWMTSDRSHILLPGRSGKLHVINPLEGQLAGSFSFPQTPAYPPVIDPASRRAFILGEHSHLFILRLDSRECERVVYLGHERGQLCAPPALISGYLVIPERRGSMAGCLRIVDVNTPDRVRVVQTVELPRPVASSLQVFGMRFVFITSDGQLQVYQLRGGEEKQPFALLAEGKTPDPAPSQKGWRIPRFVIVHKDQVIAADTALTQFGLQASAGKLVPQWVACQETIALSAPVAQDSTIIYMHRYPDRPGIFITAVDVESGRVFWETQVADPPLTEARLSDDAQSIEAIGQSGVIYRFDVASNAISLSGIRPDRVLRFPGLTDGRIPRGCVLPSNQWIMGVPGNRELFVLQPHQDRTQVTTLPLPRQMSSLPVPFKNGVLIGLEDGSLALLDATTQQPIGQPFQCDVAPGERITWSDLLPIDADTVVAANSAGWLLKLVWTDQPTGHFEIKQSRLFDSPVVSPLCMLGDHLVIIDAKNNVLTLNLNDLATVANQELQTNVVWGPLNAGSIACFAMADGTLMLLSPDLKFTKVNINGELPVGKPVVLDNRLVIATRQGSLLALDPVQATIVRRVTFPTACATGPTVVDETLVVGTLDGRWIMVPKPDALHDATKN